LPLLVIWEKEKYMKRTLKTMNYFKNEINTKIRRIQQKFDEAESLNEK
jgi:hypothetical protein